MFSGKKKGMELALGVVITVVVLVVVSLAVITIATQGLAKQGASSGDTIDSGACDTHVRLKCAARAGMPGAEVTIDQDTVAGNACGVTSGSQTYSCDTYNRVN